MEPVGPVQKDHIPLALFRLELLHAAEPGIFNGQAGFLVNLPDHGIGEGFLRLHMAPGKGHPRPVGIAPVLDENIAVSVGNHA